MNRRKLLKQGVTGAALGLISPRILSQIAVMPVQLHTVLDHSYSEQYPDMLVSYLTERLNALAENWDEVRAKIRSAADAEARAQYIRQTALELIGGLPERTPLNPVVTRVLERDGYRIENVRFESRPNFWVTANLYVPTTGKGPFPGIVSPSGHYEDAGRSSAYQRAHLDFVKNGFVVLAPDPIGQGERRLYWNTTTQSYLGSTIDEHSMFAQTMWLLGDSLTQYFAWDCIRSVDYLVSRPEVDGSRIGCSGHSGGGFQTVLLMLYDPRLKCAACIEPGAYQYWPIHIPSGDLMNPGDGEENWFPAATKGLDFCDFYQSFAPRPLLLAVETYTNKSFETAVGHIRAHYRIFGAEEKFQTVEATDAHYWTVKLRLAATDWFCRWFYDRSGPTQEAELTVEPVDNLFCTPTGSLADAGLGDTVRSIILKKQESLPPSQPAPKSLTELQSYRGEMQGALRRLLRLKPVEQSLDVRHLATTPRMGFSIEKVEFLSEPKIYVPAWVFLPERPVKDARPVLYIGDIDTDTVGYPESGWGGALAQMGHPVIAVDVRGMGQTRPLHRSYFDNGTWSNLFDVETAMSYMAWSMDDSLLGMRVHDVMRSVDYAFSRPEVDRSRMVVIGSGMGAVWGLYAAVLDPRIPSLIADGGLLSYKSLVQSDRYKVGANLMILGVMKQFDLPQAAAAIADKRLVMISPVGPMNTPVPLEGAWQAYEFAQHTYKNLGTNDQFRIVSSDPVMNRAEQYHALLGV